MDTTKTVTHIGLCAGYGGIELGLQRIIRNMRSVAFCEIEAFAIANLVAKMEAGLMDPAPIWPDLKTFPWAAFRDRVDILTGGYPCQPFSSAGKRAGKEDPRHLWPWIADGIRLVRPRLCFFENVEGHISLGLSDVIEDLAGMGYRTTWGIFSASEVGAPHQRKRVFILAYANCERGQGSECFLRDACEIGQGREDSAANSDIGNAWPSRPGEQQYGWEPPRVVADAKFAVDRRETEWNQIDQPDTTGPSSRTCGSSEAMGDFEGGARLGDAHGETGHAAQSDEELGDTEGSRAHGAAGSMEGQKHQEEGKEPKAEHIGQIVVDHGCGTPNSFRQTQSALGRDTDGAANRMDYAKLCISSDNKTDELRMLGNGVVPATAELAFKTLMKELLEYTE